MKSNWLEHFGDKFNAQDKDGIKYKCPVHGCNSEIVRKGKFLEGRTPHSLIALLLKFNLLMFITNHISTKQSRKDILIYCWSFLSKV